MTSSRCTLRFDIDKANGPGYGRITAHCPGIGQAGITSDSTVGLLVRDPSSGLTLGSGGWQPGDERLVLAIADVSGDTITLPVGPALVDHLELQAIYQIAIFADSETLWQGGLAVDRIAYSRDPSLLSASAPLSLDPVPAPEAEPERPLENDFLYLKERPKHRFGAIFCNIFFAILTVALLGGSGYFFYTRILPTTELKTEEASPEVLKHESATLEPGKEAPIQYAPGDLKGATGLQVARDALKRKVDPKSALDLARQLSADPADLKAQDGAFLLIEDAANKGDADALDRLGDAYSPEKPALGSIKKDPELAKSYYAKAAEVRKTHQK